MVFLSRGGRGGGWFSSVISESESLLLSLISELAFMFFRFDDFKGTGLPGRIRSIGIVSDRRIDGGLASGEG